MTNPNKNDGAKPDAIPTGERALRSGSTSAPASGPVSAHPATQSADRAHNPSGRPADAQASPRGDQGTARSHGDSRRDGTTEAVRSLIQCVEQLVREIPHGATAKLDGVTEGIRKAREALDRSSGESSAQQGGPRDGSKVSMTASPTSPAGKGNGSKRPEASHEDRASESKPMSAGI